MVSRFVTTSKHMTYLSRLKTGNYFLISSDKMTKITSITTRSRV